MNHIARLQTDLADARADLRGKAETIQAFRVHLASDKFAGFDPNGGRRDWIATRDVHAWLSRIAEAEV